MRLLRGLISFSVGTVLGTLGQKTMGIWGMFLGSIAGMIAGYWGARRLMP